MVVAGFLLPGYSWILISDLPSRFNALEKLVLAFILSLSFLSLLSAGLSIFTSSYLFYASAIALVIGLILGVAWFVRRFRSLSLHSSSLGVSSVPLLVAILGSLVMLVVLFWSSPYYPTAEAPDLLVHFRGVQAVVEGEGKNLLLSANYAIGLYFAAAIVASTLQILPLDALRILMAPVLLAIISLVFSSARAMLGSARAAGFTALIAAFVLPVDAIHFIRVGTFPNIVEDAIVLTMLWLFFSYVRKPSTLLGLTLTFLGLAGAFMHSSFLIFLGVLLVSNLVAYLLFRKQFRNYIQASLFSTAGIALLALLLGPFLRGTAERVFTYYFERDFLTSSVFNTTIAILVRNLGYFYGWVNFATVVLALVYTMLRRRASEGAVLAALWTLILLVIPFFSNQQYRFVLFSMLPATFLAGNLIDAVHQHLSASSLHFAPVMRKSVKLIVPLILLVLAMSGSLPYLVTWIYAPFGRSRQEAVFDSMTWLKNNGCSSGVASSGLWPDYQYLPALTGIPYRGDFVRPPDVILEKSLELQFSCVVASHGNPFFQSFALNEHFQERYRNEMVSIFLLKP